MIKKVKFKLEKSGFEIYLEIRAENFKIELRQPTMEGKIKYAIQDLTIETIYRQLEDMGYNCFGDNKKVIDGIRENDSTTYIVNLPLIITSDYKIHKQNEISINRKAFVYAIKFSDGEKYKSHFKKGVKLDNCCFQERLVFKNSIFEEDLITHQICEFLNGIDFENCIFRENVDFRNCISGTSLPDDKYYYNAQETNLKNCIFEKQIKFSNSIFVNNVYFNNSNFKGYADFHECEFEKTANFYGVTFDETINFSQTIFKGNLNIVNATLNFDFDDLESKIKQEHENNNKKSLDKFANDFRDSFRGFKSALIKDNNLLDASKFHKYELYCKEIELKQSWNKKGKNVENITDTQKNTWHFRDCIEYLLLTFYRKLSDHHTDFLKTFNNIILLIALYSIFIFTAGYKIESNTKTTSSCQN